MGATGRGGTPRVIAIVPAYNEQECLARTIGELVSTCPDIDYLVVNDGSSDDTPKICDELRLNHIDLPVNCGLSAAFGAGMRYALEHGYDAAVQFDSDGQHVPSYIPSMVQAMAERDADIVIASRVVAGGSAVGLRGFGAKLITLLIRLTTGQVIGDPTSGMRLYSRSMIEHFSRSFDLSPEPDTIAYLIRRGAKVVEVPTVMRDRQGGTSYLRLSSSLSYMARTCLSLLLFQWFR
ncbi:glycosyltransferase family 2 protein [Olsenella sp. DNF00959]|uniref:glycosyltransferase family 2 protein n=1 Tax=Olsenella sp. DNF00959 TaxID=1476999 RepID=UPI0007830A8A|nr:glycosyltransferase family 2 protein [Olsenella sp. DNF00959]KXB62388.1 glycosyltransferase, group 2 family protein [Olsenella sp. DNF00959]